MKDNKIKTMAYMALYVALYVVLKFIGNMIPFLDMPNGGSIELELIAVFIASYHLGWVKGLLVGLLSWVITIVMGFEMWFVSPVQIILDYAGPLAVCGMASLLWPFRSVSKPAAAVLSVAVGIGAFFGICRSWNGVAAVIAGAAVGVATVAFTFWYVIEKKKFGIVIAMVLKYAMTVLSGVYFWFPESAAAGSPAAWTYSIGYNLWYNLVTMIVCVIAVPMLISRLEKANIKFRA